MLLNLLKNNFGLKLFAVCLALTAWGYFHLAAAPGTTAKFDQTLEVPIVVSGLKPGYIARYTDKLATVVVEAPRNGPPVRADQLEAVLDVHDLVDPGEHYVRVNVVSPDLAIKSLSPGSVKISLGRLTELTGTVRSVRRPSEIFTEPGESDLIARSGDTTLTRT